ncbi:MAG: 2Fe-2S iron-sulfur cluster-binding protein [Nanoarchaeota archaeon]|nr:2Fe-2S iron-sulfur cluster-binding protein [Nanoarchaeota archaeon]
MDEEKTSEDQSCFISVDDVTKKVPLNEKFISDAEELGITFGCTDGICGTCIVEVDEGMECLGEKNQEEKDMALDDNQRLVCQCTFKKPGKVIFRY